MKKEGTGTVTSGLTHDELVIACKNVGVDLTCPACACAFYAGTRFAGVGLVPHSCPESELDPKALEAAAAWDAIARMHRYNEMAKIAKTLGEQVYCRLARDAACEEASRLGAEITRTETGGAVIFEINETKPAIKFRESDIEMMRDAVRAFDAAHRTSNEPIPKDNCSRCFRPRWLHGLDGLPCPAIMTGTTSALFNCATEPWCSICLTAARCSAAAARERRTRWLTRKENRSRC